jgi:hypothetical protein
MLSQPEFERGSFRDRSARVFHRDGLIFRAISESSLREVDPGFRTSGRDR